MDVNVGKRCLIAKSSISLRAMLPWTRSPSRRLPVRVTNIGSSGWPGRIMTGSTSMPTLRAAWLILRDVRLGEGIALVGQHADTPHGGNEFADQLGDSYRLPLRPRSTVR